MLNNNVYISNVERWYLWKKIMHLDVMKMSDFNESFYSCTFTFYAYLTADGKHSSHWHQSAKSKVISNHKLFYIQLLSINYI